MKFPIITTAALSLCAIATSVQAEIKVASVNVTETYTMFYKRFNTEEELQKQAATIRAELKERQDKLQNLQEEAKAIAAQNDPSLSEAKVSKLREEYNRKVNQLQAMNNEFQDFAKRREVAFNTFRENQMRLLFQDIQKALKEVSEKGNYDLVINSGAVSPQSGFNALTEVFPYVKSSLDITPEVIKILNADAPEGFNPEAELKKAAEAAQQAAQQAAGQASPAAN